MATIREMIETHNDLAATIGVPAITAWKQAGDKLQARIDAMQAQADMENGVNDAAILAEGEAFVSATLDFNADASHAEESAHIGPDGGRIADPLAIPEEAQEPLGETEPDAVSPNGAETTTDEHVEPVVPSRGVGKLIASLLVDPEAFDYPTICDIVRGEFPNARTSTRSIASVAAGLRRKGVDVPMRRNAKG